MLWRLGRPAVRRPLTAQFLHLGALRSPCNTCARHIFALLDGPFCACYLFILYFLIILPLPFSSLSFGCAYGASVVIISLPPCLCTTCCEILRLRVDIQKGRFCIYVIRQDFKSCQPS